MELIASFSVDHTKIIPGIFTSRVDNVAGETVTTYDIRVTKPNVEPAIDVAAMHSLEHIIATYIRNDEEWKNEMIYWGPMGCLTGFYLILKGSRAPRELYGLMLSAFQSVENVQAVPGTAPAETPTVEPDGPQGDVCALCGKTHDGFFGKLVGFFHRIVLAVRGLFEGPASC